MGNFKIEKQADAEPVYCDYIQEKVDIARENGAVYELEDEDNRIQALYNQEQLVTKDKIKVINRIRSLEDGKEYIVVNKNVDFFSPDPRDANKPGAYKDRYSCREGIIELPLKSINPETGATEVKEKKIVFTEPFSASKVDEYLKKCEEDGTVPTLTFYEGSTTSTRLPSNIPVVGNAEYFKQATWNELLVGREEKAINSVVNRLPEIRKKIKGTQPDIQEQPVPLRTEKKEEEEQPVKEVNKQEKVNEFVVKEKGGSNDTDSRFKSTTGNNNSKSEVSNKKN